MNRGLICSALALTLGAVPLLAQNKAPPPQRGAPPPPAAQAAKPDTGANQGSVSEKGSRGQMSLLREVFSYSNGGRRDPMVSLMGTGDIRPLISEVKLTGIVYDEEGTDHWAILLNIVDKKTQYRIKVGQMLGRMKVTQITRNEVVFTLDEFGFSRQERLSVKPDTTAARTP